MVVFVINMNILTEVNVSIVEENYRSFGGKYCLHLQGRRKTHATNQQSSINTLLNVQGQPTILTYYGKCHICSFVGICWIKLGLIFTTTAEIDGWCMGGLFMLQLQHNIIELVVVWVVHDVTILLVTVSGPRQRRDMICDERNIREREREVKHAWTWFRNWFHYAFVFKLRHVSLPNCKRILTVGYCK